MSRFKDSAFSFIDSIKEKLPVSKEAENPDYFDNEEYEDFDDAYINEGHYYDDATYGQAFREITPPRLVSFDDVRRSTRYSETAAQEAAKAEQDTQRMKSLPHLEDRLVATERAVSEQSFENPYAMHDQKEHAGLHSLFSATDGHNDPVDLPEDKSNPASYDPYKSYACFSQEPYNANRKLKVITPSSYDQVEEISRILKLGDVLVLHLQHTSKELSKRILDFSFGASSMVDATVDMLGSKIFVIYQGSKLSNQELAQLKEQGLL